MAMIKCTNCGRNVSDKSAFCAHCGLKVNMPDEKNIGAINNIVYLSFLGVCVSFLLFFIGI